MLTNKANKVHKAKARKGKVKKGTRAVWPWTQKQKKKYKASKSYQARKLDQNANYWEKMAKGSTRDVTKRRRRWRTAPEWVLLSPARWIWRKNKIQDDNEKARRGIYKGFGVAGKPTNATTGLVSIDKRCCFGRDPIRTHRHQCFRYANVF